MRISVHPFLGEEAAEEITIFFEGRKLNVRKGNTIASSLLGFGIKKLGVSRKMSAPRGMFCATGRCCSCLVIVNGKEHVRACVTKVKEGMRISRNLSDPKLRCHLK